MEHWILFSVIAFCAFLAEFADSSLGMGYGTLLTPMLLLLGFSQIDIVPAILLSELLTGTMAALLFHKEKVVDLNFRNASVSPWRYLPQSQDARIAFVLAACSVVGVLAAAVVVVKFPKFYLQVVIGFIIFAMGVLILWRSQKPPLFSWPKIFTLGAVAAFNKGVSGGGYGPIVTAGQILSGVQSKNSIAITSFAEAFTCLLGLITYMALVPQKPNWHLAPFLTLGAVCAVPCAVYSVKRIRIKHFTTIVGLCTLLLGAYTLLKTILA